MIYVYDMYNTFPLRVCARLSSVIFHALMPWRVWRTNACVVVLDASITLSHSNIRVAAFSKFEKKIPFEKRRGALVRHRMHSVETYVSIEIEHLFKNTGHESKTNQKCVTTMQSVSLTR